jgi:glutamate/aspartate transport system substrate-binding protein
MMRKGDAAFKQTVDGVIGDLVQSGEFERLYNKWFMSAIPPRGLNLNLPMSRDLRENLRALSDRPLF